MTKFFHSMPLLTGVFLSIILFLPERVAHAQSVACNPPAQPGAISGPAATVPSRAYTYSIGSVPSAQSYVWTVPADWTISSGQGTTSLSVVTGRLSGDVEVYATKGPNCNSAVRVKAVTVDLPAVYTLLAGQNIDAYYNGLVVGQVTDPNGRITAASLRAGSLPNGTVLNTSNGQITVASAASLVPGTYSFQIRTTDEKNGQSTHNISLRILPDQEALVMVYPIKNFSLYSEGDTLIGFVDYDGEIVSASLSMGALPHGTHLDMRTGTITVADPAGLLEGDFNFTIQTVDQTGGLSEIPVMFTFRQATPLPVTLVQFDARRVAGEVLLEWTTATEENNDKFIVERSTDGVEFSKLGEVKGRGTSSTTSRYSFADIYPLRETAYYRLKQLDTDGKFAYSAIKAVKAQELGSFDVFPNPAAGTVQVKWAGDVGDKASLTLMSASGQIIRTWNFGTEAGTGRQLELGDVGSGLYLLILTDGQSVQSQRLVKE